MECEEAAHHFKFEYRSRILFYDCSHFGAHIYLFSTSWYWDFLSISTWSILWYLSALYLTINPAFHAQTKHVKLDYYFRKRKVAIGASSTNFIIASYQLPDIFTKTLSKPPFTDVRTKLGVQDHSHLCLKVSDKEIKNRKMFPFI